MQYSHLILPALLWSSLSFGQTERKMTPVHSPSNIERYQDDYELKNYTFVDGDSSILNSIQLDEYESLRQMDQNIEIDLTDLNQTLILYSVNSVGRKEKQTNLNTITNF
jgi:hypothetical protein